MYQIIYPSIYQLIWTVQKFADLTISRFAVTQDRKWWLEATDLQETYPH